MMNNQVIKRKFVSGILTVIFSAFLLMQSFAVFALYPTSIEDGVTAGLLGIILAGLGLAYGIVNIATRKKNPKKEHYFNVWFWIIVILFGVFVANIFSGDYSTYFNDLPIWTVIIVITVCVGLPNNYGFKGHPYIDKEGNYYHLLKNKWVKLNKEDINKPTPFFANSKNTKDEKDKSETVPAKKKDVDSSLDQRLLQLKKMYDNNLISKDDYEEKKKAILKEL